MGAMNHPIECARLAVENVDGARLPRRATAKERLSEAGRAHVLASIKVARNGESQRRASAFVAEVEDVHRIDGLPAESRPPAKMMRSPTDAAARRDRGTESVRFSHDPRRDVRGAIAETTMLERTRRRAPRNTGFNSVMSIVGIFKC